MMTNNSNVATTLENYRAQLSDCIAKPIDIASYRDELVRDIAALKCCTDDPSTLVSSHLKELKNCEKRLEELEKIRDGTKQFQNKMKYSTITQQIDVAKSKVIELSKEINHTLRTSELMAKNQKRIKIEVERLDTIVFKTIKELPNLDTLKQATDKYVPLGVAREKSLEAMTTVVKELDATRKTMGIEQIEHKEAVEVTKSEIKRAKADIEAISNGKHPIQTNFEAELSTKRSSRSNDMEAKYQAIKEEIENLKVELTEDQTIHNANLVALDKYKRNISQQITAIRDQSTSFICDLDTKLSELKNEHADHNSALEKLEQRKDREMEEDEERANQERLRLEEKARVAAREEHEHFAALWIQLRWKAHMKRQLIKQASSKGKKKGKKSKK